MEDTKLSQSERDKLRETMLSRMDGPEKEVSSAVILLLNELEANETTISDDAWNPPGV